MVADDYRGLAGRQRIAGDDDFCFIGSGEDALDVQPHRRGDQGGSIIGSSGSDEGERQEEGEQGVCEAQAQQPRQQMQGGADKVAEALERRRR